MCVVCKCDNCAAGYDCSFTLIHSTSMFSSKICRISRKQRAPQGVDRKEEREGGGRRLAVVLVYYIYIRSYGISAQEQCEQVKQIQLVSADHDQRANPSRTASQAN